MRKIATILIFTMLICVIPMDVVSAQDNLGERTNFKFIQTSDLSNIHYTYEENGKTYSVYEKCNEDLSEINTEIYCVKGDTEKIVEEFETHINTVNEVMHIEKYIDGKIVEKNSIDLTSKASISSRNTRSASTTYNGNVYYDGRTGKYYTGWFYTHSYTGSNVLKQVTYAVAIHVVAEIAGIALPEISVAIDIIEVAVQALVAANISTVYWEKDEYHVNQITYPGRQFYGTYVGEKTYAKLYSDSARTKYIESVVYESHYPEKWPEGLYIGNAYN